MRIAGVNCTQNQTPVWQQTFSFDPFGNISKTAGNVMFTPTYSTSTNRITSAPFTGACPERSRRDANGNTTQDNAHAYSWDAEGRPVTLDAIGATYDALGRVVEQNGTTEIVYGLGGGKLALMNGQTAGGPEKPGGPQTSRLCSSGLERPSTVRCRESQIRNCKLRIRLPSPLPPLRQNLFV